VRMVPKKLQVRFCVAALLSISTLVAQAQIRAVTSAQAQADQFSSPAVDAGDYVYISGQGPQRPDGKVPATFDEQVRQSLDNIKSIVEAAGLTMNNVVYTQVYLTDIGKYGELNRVFGEYFPKTPPARAVLGVAAIPQSSIEINAVAVRDLTGRRAIVPTNSKSNDSASPGVLTHDRLFVSGMAGVDTATGKVPDDPAAQVDLALDRMQAVLKAAGLEMANMVFVNPYLTSEIPGRVMNQRYARRFEFGNTPARATIEVTSLPGGAHIEYTGVAVRD
jgi:reactive intermediate/imine deaminase